MYDRVRALAGDRERAMHEDVKPKLQWRPRKLEISEMQNICPGKLKAVSGARLRARPRGHRLARP